MNAVTERLIQARARIADEENWCRGHMYDGTGPHGMRMCAVGAIFYLGELSTSVEEANARNLIITKANDLMLNACTELFGKSITRTNDTLGHAAVLQAFDKAIEDSMPEIDIRKIFAIDIGDMPASVAKKHVMEMAA